MNNPRNLTALLATYNIKPPTCGASCGPGWRPLIEALIKDLLALGWDRECDQIKEKFAGLRFYVGKASEEMYELIHAAEFESLHICEECGEHGHRVNIGGWIKTRCEKHAVGVYR